MEDPLGQPTRRRIYEVVSDHPGASAREVQRHARLGWGETAYHLDQLTRAGVLRRERGGRRDYYFRLEVTWDDRRLLLGLRSLTERRILLELVERPGPTLGELSDRIGVGLSTSSFHVRHLLDLGLVHSVRDGNFRRFHANHPERTAELLSKYRESFQDRLVDAFVETWSSLLR